jgi:N-acetylneuraminic acid mutarotase
MRSVLWIVVAGCSSPAAHVDAPSSHWTSGTPLPVPRLEPGVTALGQRVVVLGGFDTDLMAGLEITKRVDVYDPAADPAITPSVAATSNPWSQLPDAPVAWTHVQLAAVGTTLYLLGGLAGQTYTAQGEAFALDTQDVNATWRPIAAMPAGMERGSAAVVVSGSRIYLLGGAGTNAALATNLYYDTQADTWGQLMPDLPAPRSHPAGIRRADGTLVVAGGLGTLDSTSQAGDTWQLVPLGTVWTSGMMMPEPRGGCAYGEIQGQLVCAGGEAGPSAYKSVESYDPLADTWTELEPMPDSRAGAQGAAIGDRLFVPGGARQLVYEPLATLFVYTANL